MGSPCKQAPVELVKESDLDSLMGIFFKQSFCHNASDAEMVAAFEGIQQKCMNLFSKDYTVKIIDNKGGSLSSSYPEKIMCLALPADDGDDQEARAEELRQRMKKARAARAWTRFVVPIILYDGKHICRSATLSGGVEIYTRMAAEKVYDASANLCTYIYSMVSDSAENTPTSSLEASQESTVCTDKHEDSAAAALSSLQGEVEDEPSVAVPMAPEDDASVHGELRNEDIQLLKFLSINQICDLMVEKKKQKLCINLTSSEKVDKFNRYRDFTIFQLPFPGCEFFDKYSRSGYRARGLIFDWSQEWIDAELQVPDTSLFSELDVNWEGYKKR
ncbi:myotubularin-related protein 14-like [Rhipicephalus sanguineus]|uniref:myotubularin-related protein 14-like n=1 Tax=Rhipicephalus sanguineus TaxID=34632 RepID=UPI0020C4A18D|nr:myotubularin-related protein 14-like [Rhipicephalus sanguineus]